MSERVPTAAAPTTPVERVAPVDPARVHRRRARQPAGSTGRRTRFVKIMRLLLPLFAGALIALVALWPQFLERQVSFRLGLTDIEIAEKGGQSLINARIEGIDGKDRPFTVTATSVAQLKNGLADVALAEPKADIELHNGTWLALTAEAGQFRRRGQTLSLTGRVNIFHDSGYEFKTETAVIDMTRAIAYGDSPVAGQGPLGGLEAEGFRVVDGGDRVVFMGKTKMTIHLDGQGTK